MKIKSLLRRFFRGWFPAEPKKLNQWSKNKLRITLFISFSIIVASAIIFGILNLAATPQMMPPLPLLELPTQEPDYYPGVSVGDYVIYDFVCNVSHPTEPEWDWISCLGDVDWRKLEVIGVSGKEVILRYTEQLKNGSASDHSGCVHVLEDIEHPAWINGTCKYAGYYFGSTVVAANLTEGDSIHSSGPCPMPMHLVNKTEIRTYLGASRWVNIMKNPQPPSLTNWVFDVESGMLLEYEELAPNNERTAYSIVETNIFSSPTQSPTSSSLQENTAQSIPTEAPYATTGLVGIVIFGVTMVIFRKRRLKWGENNKE